MASRGSSSRQGCRMMIYPMSGSGQRIVFAQAVLNHFAKHRQDKPEKTEAGGLLFAKVDFLDIHVQKVTGPRTRDIRKRTLFRPHGPSEQKEIDKFHKRGLHFVGVWHTHPEAVPSPSQLDISSICGTFSRSVHSRDGFILVIVGTDPIPDGLSVSVCTDTETVTLIPETV